MDMGPARFAYVGTYTQGAPGGWSDAAEAVHPDGLCVFKVSPDGDFTLIQTVVSTNPAFVILHPSQHALYVANETSNFEGRKDGSLESYTIDSGTGKLTLLNRASSMGSLPAHMAINPDGKYLLLANYGSGNIVAIRLHEDGSLGDPVGMIQNQGSGPSAGRQETSHPHAVTFDPSGRYIAVADLGTDQIMILALNDTGLTHISEAKVTPGSGPRHVAFHPNGKVLYVINELAGSITGFTFDPATGVLGKEIQTIATLPVDFPANGNKGAAGIIVHPSGKFLYASNRKFENHPMADSIVAYRIDQVTNILTLIGYTIEGIICPRAINCDLTGQWLYALNQKGDTIVQFAINHETDDLIPTGIVVRVKVPVSIAFKQ